MKVLFWGGLFLLSGWLSMVLPTSVAEAGRKIRFAEVGAKGVPTIQESELAWKLPTQTQAQTWIFWAWNPQGYFVTIFLISTRFLFVSRLGVQLTVYTPSGEVKHLVKEYEMNQVIGLSGRLMLEVAGKHKWNGSSQKGMIEIDFGKWGCSLQYQRVLPGYRHMNGSMRFGKERFDGITFAPKLTVQGSLRWAGKQLPFQGTGYADYSLQTITPKRLAQRWYALRGGNARITFLAHHLQTVNTWTPQSLPGFSVARDRRWLLISQPRHITYFRAYREEHDQKAGYRVPMRVVYKAKDDRGVLYHVDIQHKKQVMRVDLLGHVNSFLRFFIRQLLSNPFVYRYQAEVVLSIQEPGQPRQREKLQAYAEWLYVQ